MYLATTLSDARTAALLAVALIAIGRMPAVSRQATAECVDTIADHPVCMFAALCDCSTTIQSHPCGTDITSQMGNSVPVNDVCAKTCDACSNQEEATASPAQTPFPGNVYGRMPMGSILGRQGNLHYNVTEHRVQFHMTFPDTTSWIGFHYWSTSSIASLTNGKMQSATSGYECRAMDSDEIVCNGRRLRHFYFNWDSLPGEAEDLIGKHSVTTCSVDQAKVLESDGTSPYCIHDPNDTKKSSVIISVSTSEIVFVTEYMDVADADMEDLSITRNNEQGTVTASWTRSRDYPWNYDNGAALEARWTVASATYDSDWSESGLLYHGPIAYQRWPTGWATIYMDPAAQAAAQHRYEADANAYVDYLADGADEALALFRTNPSIATDHNSEGGRSTALDGNDKSEDDIGNGGEDRDDDSAANGWSGHILAYLASAVVLLILGSFNV